MSIPQARHAPETRWVRIPWFPGYSISDTGFVRNDNSGRTLARLVNQNGVVYVGLMRDGRQFKRSIAPMVAGAFLPLPTHPYHRRTFDTPIHRDGDSKNNHVDNLLWRPRWFAVKYHKQFGAPPRGFRVPIAEVETGEEFPTSWEAAVKYGLLDYELGLAIVNGQGVWPTGQRFVRIGAIDTVPRQNRGL